MRRYCLLQCNAVYFGRQMIVKWSSVLSSMFSIEEQFVYSESKAVNLCLGVEGFGFRSGDNLPSQRFLMAFPIFSRQMSGQYLQLDQHLPFPRPAHFISLFTCNKLSQLWSQTFKTAAERPPKRRHHIYVPSKKTVRSRSAKYSLTFRLYLVLFTEPYVLNNRFENYFEFHT